MKVLFHFTSKSAFGVLFTTELNSVTLIGLLLGMFIAFIVMLFWSCSIFRTQFNYHVSILRHVAENYSPEVTA